MKMVDGQQQAELDATIRNNAKAVCLTLSFRGRMCRKTFWLSFLAIVAISCAASLIALCIGLGVGDVAKNGFFVGWGIGVVMLAPVFILLPTITLVVRRLHDLGRSGWYCLLICLASFIPFVDLVVFLIMIFVLSEDSQPGVNEWGPNPKELAKFLREMKRKKRSSAMQVGIGPSVLQSLAQENEETRRYMVFFNNAQWGPYTGEQINDMVNKRQIPMDVMVWTKGMETWEPWDFVVMGSYDTQQYR